ncbi:MAG: acyltransferase family protein [Lachnospiraceae bacterium]|nr:acyltransferase family protein [Lachnospiraceae bacterium]
MKESNNVSDRKEYLDYLRLFAAFAVVLLHVAAQNLGAFYFDKNIWEVFNIYDSMGHCGPPLFVMISGALFLGRDIDIKKIYSKYIFRILIAFCVWNFIYYLSAPGGPVAQIAALFGDEKPARFADLIKGHYHLWFLPMIIGVYMCIPILKLIADNEKIGKYFIIIGVIFTCVIPTLYNIVADFGSPSLNSVVNAIRWNHDQGLFFMPLGYSFYFVLGYYISNKEISKPIRYLCYAISVLGYVMEVLLERFAVLKSGDILVTYYESLSLQVFMQTLGIFIFFRYLPLRGRKINGFISKAAKVTFGSYLVHVLLMEQLNARLGINTLTLISPASPVSVAITTPVIAILIFAASLLISAILSHIPVVNKYLV